MPVRGKYFIGNLKPSYSIKTSWEENLGNIKNLENGHKAQDPLEP